MEVARCELLFAVGSFGQEVEVAQVEVSGNVHVYPAEGMAVVNGGMCAVVVGIPFDHAAGEVQCAVHAVHVECQVEPVFRGEAEQIIGADVEVAVVAIAHAQVAGCGFGWLCLAGIGLHVFGGNISFERLQPVVVFHGLGLDHGGLYGGHGVDFVRVANVGVVFLLYHDGTVQRGVLGLRLCGHSCGEGGQGYEDEGTYFLHVRRILCGE